MEKYPLFLNAHSGTILRLGEEKAQDLILGHMGQCISEIYFLDIVGAPEKLLTLAHENPHGVLVGGGDGTAVFAAEQLAEDKIPFGVLPFGTMNLLAQDLGAAPTFEQTLQTFKSFKPDVIDCGVVNGRKFLCSAVIGFVPEGAVLREEIRDNASLQNMAQFISMIARGIGGDDKHDLFLKSSGLDKPYALTTTALIIANNGFVQNPDIGAQRFLRSSLTDGKLAVYSASPRDMMDGLKMALSMWQGDWQDHDSIMSFDVEELIVESPDKKTLISLDGEPVEMSGALNFSVAPRSVPVLRMELAA